MAGRSQLSLIQEIGVPALNTILQDPCKLPFTSQEQVDKCRAASIANTPVQSAFDKVAIPALLAISSLIPVVGAAAGLTGGFAYKASQQTAPTGKPLPLSQDFINAQYAQPTAATGGRKMAFQDGDTSFFPDFNMNSIFQGGFGQNLLNIGTQALSGYVGQQFAPQPVSYQTNMAVVPAAARAVATVGRGFFQKFPNLATSIQALRNAGKNVTRAKLYSALKRFGPEMLVSGGLLTAAAVSELAVAGPGRRRMNAGNVKALRKAHRRMVSFHKVCRKNDMLMSHGRKRK